MHPQSVYLRVYTMHILIICLLCVQIELIRVMTVVVEYSVVQSTLYCRYILSRIT
jgi:hypothetical protein